MTPRRVVILFFLWVRNGIEGYSEYSFEVFKSHPQEGETSILADHIVQEGSPELSISDILLRHHVIYPGSERVEVIL